MPQVRSVYCPECRGFRAHEVLIHREPKRKGGKITRIIRCSCCTNAIPLGVCCPKCGDVRLRQCFTRHRGAATIRVMQCVNPKCGHRIRTRTVIESFAS